jgi:hypothetical protein
MDVRLKNTINDIFFFIIYHLVFLTFSAVVLLSFKYDISLNNLDKLKEMLLNFPASLNRDSKMRNTNFPKIEKLGGEVEISEPNTASRRAIKGDILKKDMVLTTGKNSFVFIALEGEYSWQLRLSANTKVNINELMTERGPEKSKNTLLDLIKGGLLFSISKRNNNDRFEVKTPTAVFAVRGTKFSVIKDEDSVVLAVKNGVVEVENLINGIKSSVTVGEAYLANNSGRISLNKNEELISKFDWDTHSENLSIAPEMSIIKEILGSDQSQNSNPDSNLQPETTPKDTDSSGLIKTNDLEQILTKFREDNRTLEENKKLAELNLSKIESELKKKMLLISDDISCLKNSTTGCNLHNEQLIISRGFPRTWGSPALRMSIIEDLNKYADEQKALLEDEKIQNQNLETLYNKRIQTLTQVENMLKLDHDPSEVKKLLEAKDLVIEK